MYSLDVNFLNDRTQRPTEVAGTGRSRGLVSDNPRPLYYGIAVGALLPLLVGGLWLFTQTQKTGLQTRQAELDGQLANLNARLQQAEAVRGQVAQIQQENQALATVFDQLKPWSAIMQDLRVRVPQRIQIEKITQSAPEIPVAPPPADPNQPPPPPPAPITRIEITGHAPSYDDVNDFLLSLQQSPFLDAKNTRLQRSETVANPERLEFPAEGEPGSQLAQQIEVQLPEVVGYTISTALTNQSASELLQDLRDTLAVGLPARIDALRDLGVVKP